MPYITKEQRQALVNDLSPLFNRNLSRGELNYVITVLIHKFIKTNTARGKCYDNINDAVGILECAKQELYRVVAAPYEDVKRSQNGKVSQLED